MPGSSLWLVPPPDSELYQTIYNLILKDVPPIFPAAQPPPQFIPHITLTADTVSDQEAPQEWLHGITLPTSVGDLVVKVDGLQAGKIFFQSLIMSCEKSPELCELAVHCRTAGGRDTADLQAAEKWVRDGYLPHCSLMYSGIPRDEVLGKLQEVEQRIQEVKRERSECQTAESAEIWLVPTFKSIDQWKPVAQRRLKGVAWEWRT